MDFSRANILVVDDTLANLELLEEILGFQGYEVRTATSGEMALRSVSLHIPDLILLDVMMPGIDGYETCRVFKANKEIEKVPIIFLSAKSESADKIRGFEMGGLDYITKPFDVQELLMRIKTHLRLYFLQYEYKRMLDIVDEHIMMLTTDLDGEITTISELYCQISEFTKEEMLGKTHRVLRNKDQVGTMYADIWNMVSSGKSWKGELKKETKRGKFFWVETIITPLYDINENKIGYTFLETDITYKKEGTEQSTVRDPLTHLFNQRYFELQFQIGMKRSRRYNLCFSLILIDIDYFKEYNFNYGYEAGDEVLRRLASAFRKHFSRADDLFFRFEGDRFGGIFTTNDTESSQNTANKILDIVNTLQLEHQYSEISSFITVSLGLVTIDCSEKNSNSFTTDEMLQLAEETLNDAKKAGRNTLRSVIVMIG